MLAVTALPTPGWGTSPFGAPTYTKIGAGFLDVPPPLDGFRPSFIGRTGTTFTRWTYRPLGSPA